MLSAFIENNALYIGMFFVSIVSFINGTTESRSYFFRLAGNITGNRSMGWAVHNAYLTLNRASALSVIFVLAILLDLGISSRDMGWICMSAIIGVALANIVMFLRIKEIKEKSIEALLIYKKTGDLLKTSLIFFTPIRSWFYIKPKTLTFRRKIKNFNAFRYSILIYSLFGLSLFLVVFLASNFLSYRAVILQTTALVNVIGTFYLTSVLDPILSRMLDSEDNFEEIFLDVIYGRSIAYIFICPFIFLTIVLIT